MSQENVEVVLRAIEAANRQDADAFVATATPEIESEDAIFGRTVFGSTGGEWSFESGSTRLSSNRGRASIVRSTLDCHSLRHFCGWLSTSTWVQR
jgi:hypothetical protein